MSRDEIIEILVLEYGWPINDLKDKSLEELKNLLLVEKCKNKHNPFSCLDGKCDPDDSADLFPNGRDFDAEDEGSW